jgi:hypothetical protein
LYCSAYYYSAVAINITPYTTASYTAVNSQNPYYGFLKLLEMILGKPYPMLLGSTHI